VTSGWSNAELDRLIEDVLVDAYGDSEELGAFAESGLPVGGVQGLACSLDSVGYDGDERRGLVAQVTIDCQRQRVGLVDVKVTDQGHEAARLTAAFERWWVPAE
jgi:hypothetical protein